MEVMDLSDSDDAMSIDNNSDMKENKSAKLSGFLGKPTAGSRGLRDIRNLPWVEKYRPAKVEDVAHQEEVVRAMKTCTEKRNLPHLLFYGPPGTGKTSLILAVAKELYGATHYRDRVLELNASDERGIDVIRNKVKKFAQFAVGNQKHEETGEILPPFKIIILDEADSLTKDAQAALRRIIENYTKVTRFCIICNYISRIIDPLTSRCSKFRFQPLSDTAHLDRLSLITKQEGVVVSQEGLAAAMKHADGDLRRSINLIQSAASLFQGKAITASEVTEIAGAVPQAVADSTIGMALQGSQRNKIQAHVDSIMGEGFSVTQCVQQLVDSVTVDPRLTDLQKAKAARVLSVADHRIADGADESLQLLWIASELSSICQGA
jgi:replication factor C subunit 2/4